jgi:predicted PurR-regulated permease PerM
MDAPRNDDPQFLSRAVETTVRLGLLLGLVAWCLLIVWPFVVPVAWAVIIAVAIHPVFARLEAALGSRGKLAAGLLVALGIALLIVPTLMLGDTLAEGAQSLAANLETESLHIPSPPETIRDWPFVGNTIYDTWLRASQNLPAALAPFRPQLVELGTGILAAAAGAGLTLVQFVLSIAIAGVMLANATGGGQAASLIARRVVGDQGPALADLAGATTRSVAQGILGVALIQSFLAGLGFLAVGVPGAGLWALIGMLLCVIQIGLLPVTLPILIYVFSSTETWVAAMFTVYIVVVSLLDNFLKPLLLGRGVQVPTLVIFLGSIGGFLTSGIIGLFVGSVVLVLGYTLFQAWLGEVGQPAEAD